MGIVPHRSPSHRLALPPTGFIRCVTAAAVLAGRVGVLVAPRPFSALRGPAVRVFFFFRRYLNDVDTSAAL